MYHNDRRENPQKKLVKKSKTQEKVLKSGYLEYDEVEGKE